MTFRRHLALFLAVNLALTAINVAKGPPWWAFWPLVAWGLVLMVHFLVYRATNVQDAWVDERAQDLRSKSYDASHIDDIRAHPAPSVEAERSEARPR